MGSIDSDGLYNYVAGDPVNLRDPWGLDAAAGDAVGPELDPESIPAEGTGREMVIQRQRCDAECQASREAAAERGRTLTEREQARGDRKIPSNPTPRQPTARALPVPNLHQPGDIFETQPGIEWPLAGVLGDLGFGRRLEYDHTWRVTFPPFLRPEGMPIDIATGLGAGAVAGKIGGFVCRGACPTTPLFKWLFDRSCFVAGTPVMTPDGFIAIEQLRAGDLVLARQEESGEWGWFVVERTFVRTARELVVLELVGKDGASDILEVTPEHPFRVVDGGWVAAGDLTTSDQLDGVEGALRVASIRRFAEDATVFNLEVRDAHTYFVGALGAWVHNTCFEDIAKHAMGKGRLRGKTLSEATEYLDDLAGSTLGHKTADGASIWRRGAEVLISREGGGGMGTYYVADSERDAIRQFAKFVEDNGDVVELIIPK